MGTAFRSVVSATVLVVASLSGHDVRSPGGRVHTRTTVDTVPLSVGDSVVVGAPAMTDTALEEPPVDSSFEQATADSAAPIRIPTAIPVPFGPGERLQYDVKMGLFSVGSGSLSILGVDTVRGAPTYHLEMKMKGGIPLARVDDRFQSWLDVSTLSSRRFVQRVREASYKADRHYEIFPKEKRWERTDVDDSGKMITSFPLDDISFLYYVRTLDLTPGKEYRFRRYFKEDGNPVVVKVVGRDTVEVPAGTFPTVVVRPVIQTEGLFSQGGEAELYFTDDENHYLVYMRVKIPVVRSMTLHLSAIHPGRPVAESPDADDPAAAPPGGG